MLWIPVPGGFENGGPLLRVLVVPRLSGGTPAEHGMAQWPPTALAGDTVRVETFAPGAAPPAAPDRQVDLVPRMHDQPGVWQRLVAGLPVESAEVRPAGPTDDPLTVYATSEDLDEVARTFQEASRAEVTTQLAAESPDYTGKVRDALRSDHWLGPEVSRTAAPVAGPPAARPGFNRTLSLLREHPAVLRALGLILELRLDPGGADDPAAGTVRVLWPGRPAGLPEIVSPRTAFGDDFRPAATSRVDSGMVTLDQRDGSGVPRWQVATIDVDVAAQRMREAARALATSPGEPPALPALRSDGLQLVLRGRGEDMEERRATGARTLGSEPDVLTADDLVLGYRVDVLPNLGGDEWFSLHRRRATYRVHERRPDGGLSEDFTALGTGGEGSGDLPEEGHLKTNSAVQDGNGLHADEIVAGFRGWSLAVPRPTFDGAPRPTPPPAPGTSISMACEAEEGTLPRLRFGRHYTLRARVADVAGGGLGPDDPAAERHTTAPEFYGRYEPICAPEVSFPEGTDAADLGPGESVEHVVVRSDPLMGLDVGRYAELTDHSLNDERVLGPPRSSLAVAEQHGMLDLGQGAEADRVTWEWVGRALAAAAPDAASESNQFLPDPAAGGIVAAPKEPNAPMHTRAWEERWPDLAPKTLRLTAPSTGRPVVDWEGEQLAVRLAPAERITLDLSTFPQEDIVDHFALLTAADPPPPPISVNALRQGRHPLVTPARTLALVHAVQHPLRPPETVLTVERAQNSTFAVFAPQSDVFDPRSTAQLAITASWRDQVDEVSHQVTEVPVDTLTVAADGPARPPTLFRQEFGDTRHRTVTYTLRAVSRFRDYFHDSGNADDFTVTRQLAPVVVRSTARPAPPAVVSTRPAFLWKRSGDLEAVGHTLVHERLGNRVQIALDRPWNTTGTGELLAVVVRPEDEATTEGLKPFVTQAGLDPLYPTRGIPMGAPFARHLTGAVGSERRLRLDEADADVVVVPYQPEFHSELERWLADVVFTGADSTSFNLALVQLAIARYQPNSLDGLLLSPVVRTDLVPLLPDRSLQVTRLVDRYEVKVRGSVSPAPAVNRVDMILERCAQPGGLTADQVDLVGFDTVADVPAWQSTDLRRPEPKRVGLSPTLKEWKSEFFKRVDPGPYRVRVREVELLPNKEPQPGRFLHSGKPEEVTERTVFTDTVLLPPL
ncbi:hypothetical protein AQJ84_38820 [Streptomyces resistomycificus]|uniref:Uncharacterized protein n=4 Tax=Streptomyces resistomycificus TaxID=67356 RepID=A0A0L8LXA4_9ACTN|nr:hypothetical protein ADK37_04015 [Streptomyces resistomycificus]KUN90739.1 hypothetical protein AQJ84_38820 [Streptomyces resistomycificus]